MNGNHVEYLELALDSALLLCKGLRKGGAGLDGDHWGVQLHVRQAAHVWGYSELLR